MGGSIAEVTFGFSDLSKVSILSELGSEVKMENDRENEAEKARDEGIANEFNQARAARVIQKAFRSKKRKKKLNKRRKKGTKTTKSATKRKGKEKKK